MVAEIDAILQPIFDALGEANDQLSLPSKERSPRQAAMAVLSLVWTNVMELDPDQMRRRYGSDHIPRGWPAMREELIARSRRRWHT